MWVRVIGTNRINEATLTGRFDAPPKNWRMLVIQPDVFIAATWAAFISFMFFLTPLVLRLA
jgi:hypothetical protein